jgi:AbrB family looped-hinge helix DNA binding protein
MTEKIRVSTRGRVVIPKRIRERLGWEAGCMVEWVEVGDGLVFRKVKREAVGLSV